MPDPTPEQVERVRLMLIDHIRFLGWIGDPITHRVVKDIDALVLAIAAMVEQERQKAVREMWSDALDAINNVPNPIGQPDYLARDRTLTAVTYAVASLLVSQPGKSDAAREQPQEPDAICPGSGHDYEPGSLEFDSPRFASARGKCIVCHDSLPLVFSDGHRPLVTYHTIEQKESNK